MSDKNVVFNLKVNLSDLLYHIEHRSSLKRKQIYDLFKNNKQFRTRYLNLCSKLLKDFAENELDEFDCLIDFAREWDQKINS